MKSGLLITNHFLTSPSFDTLYGLFDEAAESLGVSLARRTGGDFIAEFDAATLDEADFVLFWDKDVSLARRLAARGLPVFNSAEAIRVCDHKGETAEALMAAAIPTPRTLFAPMTYEAVGYAKTDFVEHACAELGFPLVIKECYGSFGEQVYLVRSVAEAKAVVARLGAKPFLFQKFVATSFGIDLRVNVVGDKVVCAMRRQGREGDFRSNVAAGGVGEPYTLSPREREVALAAARAVGADFAGVDLLFGGDRPLVCEVNSNPHFVGTYRHMGVNLAFPILEHILKSL